MEAQIDWEVVVVVVMEAVWMEGDLKVTRKSAHTHPHARMHTHTHAGLSASVSVEHQSPLVVVGGHTSKRFTL